jgi:hypothetical protein
MSGRNLFGFIVIGGLLTLCLGGLAPGANAASAGQASLKGSGSVSNDLVEIKHRGRRHRGYPIARRHRIYPIAPSYTYYDFPYYYARGHYPTHIFPGSVLFGYPYYYSDYGYSGYGGRCSYRHRRCITHRGW